MFSTGSPAHPRLLFPLALFLGGVFWGSILLGNGRVARAEEPLQQTTESGPVTARLTLEPAKPRIGDVVTFTIQVTAEKDVEVLMPEFGEALERFSIIDFVPRESLDEEGRLVATQRYRLQPPSSGKQAIPPILIEYVDRRPARQQAPQGLDAYELLTQRLEFEVQSVMPADVSAQLKPPLGKITPPPPPAPPWWPWILAAVVVGGLAIPLLSWAWQAWRKRARRRSAYQIARARLDRLLAREGLEQVDAFYVELSSIVRRYLEDRFQLRAPELTTEEFLTSVGNSPDLSADHQRLLREFLREADLVKFAGVRPSRTDVDRSVQAASRFLEETQENAPFLEVDSY